MLMRIAFIISFCILSDVGVLAAGLACNSPLFTNTDSITTTSFRLNWTDFNTEVLGWEIEWGTSGFSPENIPDTNLIINNSYNLSNLTPGTAYDIYIRSVCSNSEVSSWNGPFTVRTAIDNDESCQLDLAMRDNNCPRLEEFIIAVDDYPNMLLGEDIFIQSLDLIIEHDWPADLQLELSTPSGNRIPLTTNRGIGLDNYGNPADTMCMEVCSFSDFACQSISEVGTEQLVGSFLPEELLLSLYNNQEVNGNWKILSCDRAQEDRGRLKYVKINFSPVICNVPTNITAQDISSNQATITWDPPENCRVAIINVVESGLAPGTGIEIFTSCQSGSFNVAGLEGETAYDIYIQSDCNTSQSAFSCPATFVTACNEVTLATDFDDQDICISSCDASCDIAYTWNNSTEDNQDWIVYTGSSPTENTGPEQDIIGTGNYVYIENSSDLCGIRNRSILETSCLQLPTNNSPCDMSFYYHMYGSDMDSLILRISQNDGQSWETLFARYGDQGQSWQRQFINLDQYQGLLVNLQFIGISGTGDLADMALDQIEFYGANVITLPTFYFDSDNDGYGGQDSIISVCLNNPPPGFTEFSDDCDDNNKLIHPDALEVPCNLIDENCNGMEDDAADQVDINYEVTTFQNESCPGAQDGMISLEISGGNEGYQIVWNTGDVGPTLSDIGDGVYFAQISDTESCAIQTDFFDIDVINSPQIFTISTSPTQCNQSTGKIDIEVAGGTPPYQYLWNNGDITQDLNGIPEGNYSLTITDGNNCTIESENYSIISSPRFTAGIQFQKNLNCARDSSGIISIGLINSLEPVTYQWSTGQTTPLIDHLPAGAYAVTINDARGCEEILTTEITGPDTLSSQVIGIEQITCYNGSNGSIQVNTSGGNPPYDFSWQADPQLSFSSSRQEDLSNLPSGTYQMTVIDGKGCMDTTIQVSLTNPDDILIRVDSVRAVRCKLSETGYLEVDIAGGAGEYGYFWGINSRNNEPFLDNIKGGTYSLTVIDRFGCKKTTNDLEVNIMNIPLTLDAEVTNDNRCFYDTTGSITANVLNGIAPYDFNWNNGVQKIIDSPLDTITQLSGGTYKVTVTDAEGCVGISANKFITNWPVIEISDITIDQTTCNSTNDGNITVNIGGGVQPYDISWNIGVEGASLSNIANGDYYLTITDQNNCLLEAGPIEMISTNEITINSTVTDISGNSENGSISIEITGGTPPYNIDWDMLEDGLETHYNLDPGTYCVTITDATECFTNECFTVDQSNSVVENHYEKKINIYPNPASSIFFIQSELSIYNIEIIGIDGIPIRSVQQFDFIDLSAYKPGIYIAKISTDLGVVIKKLVLSK